MSSVFCNAVVVWAGDVRQNDMSSVFCSAMCLLCQQVTCHLYFAMLLLCEQVTCYMIGRWHMTLTGWCVTCTLQCICCVSRWHVMACHMTLTGWCVTCTLFCSAVVVLTGDMSYDEDRMMCHLYTLGVVALLCPSVTPKRTPMLVQSFIATPCISAAGANLRQFVHLTVSTFLFPLYFIILHALPSSFTNEKGVWRSKLRGGGEGECKVKLFSLYILCVMHMSKIDWMFSLILVYMCKSFLTRFVMCTRAHRKKCQCCVHVSVSALRVCEHVCVCEREREYCFLKYLIWACTSPQMKRAMVLFEYVHCPFILQMKKERGKTQKEQKRLFVLFVNFRSK